MDKNLNDLVHNVIWPAVAGNVLWSFLQVVADPNITGPTLWPRLASLLLIGVYLSIDWVITHNKRDHINEKYGRFDMFLAASIATFAIATQFGTWWAPFALAMVFGVAVVGNWLGAWDLRDRASSCKARRAFTGINALGLIGLGLLILMDPNEWYALWLTPVAILVVVVLYLCLREKITTRWPNTA